MVTGNELNQLKAWFSEYAGTFKLEAESHRLNITIKVEHTGRVCALIRAIGADTGLSGDKLNTAEACALFHDVGRFEQLARYGTFSDSKSVDHGDLGAEILGKEDILNLSNEEASGIIVFAVRFHNKMTIPTWGSEEQQFYTRLLRDADKLDIYRVSLANYLSESASNPSITYELPDGKDVSDEVYHDIINRRMVNMEHLKTASDFKLLQAGWVFDINFPRTFEILNEKKYIQTLFSTVPGTVKIRKIETVVLQHMNTMLHMHKKGTIHAV